MNTISALALLSILAMTGCTAGVDSDAANLQTEKDDSEAIVSDRTSEGEGLRAPGALPGEGRDVSELQLGPISTEYRLAEHGGNGGSYTGHFGNGVIYGVRMYSGDYVDKIQFAYYFPSNADNKFRTGDYWATTQYLGGGGGSNRGWSYCPTGMGVIGLRGDSGGYVDRLGITCSDADTPDPNRTANWYSNLNGGGGGSWFSDTCVGGYLIDGFNIRSGAYLDNIQGLCIAAH